MKKNSYCFFASRSLYFALQLYQHGFNRETGENTYKKNYVYLNEYTLYVVEDINGTEVDPYHYKVVFYTKTPDFDVRD